MEPVKNCTRGAWWICSVKLFDWFIDSVSKADCLARSMVLIADNWVSDASLPRKASLLCWWNLFYVCIRFLALLFQASSPPFWVGEVLCMNQLRIWSVHLKDISIAVGSGPHCGARIVCFCLILLNSGITWFNPNGIWVNKWWIKRQSLWSLPLPCERTDGNPALNDQFHMNILTQMWFFFFFREARGCLGKHVRDMIWYFILRWN